MAALAGVLAFLTDGLSIAWLRSPASGAASQEPNRADPTQAPSSDISTANMGDAQRTLWGAAR